MDDVEFWAGELEDREGKYQIHRRGASGIELRFLTVVNERPFTKAGRRNFTVTWISWGGLLYPNPISSFHSSLADQGFTNNLAGFKSREADSLMELEQITFDRTERIGILRRLDSILIESRQYALGWYAPYERIAYWNRFGHPSYYLGRLSNWSAAFSTWWVDPEKDRIIARARRGEEVRMPKGATEVRFWPAYDKQHRGDEAAGR